MNKSFIVIALAVAVSAGCATPYELSDKTVAAAQSMSKVQALQIIEQQMRPTARQRGLLQHELYPPIHRQGDLKQLPPRFNGTQIFLRYERTAVTDEARTILQNALGVTAQRTVNARPEYETKFELSDMVRVYITDPAKSFETKNEKLEGVLVDLQGREPGMRVQRLIVHIAPENLNQFLAAIKVIAPNTPIGTPPIS